MLAGTLLVHRLPCAASEPVADAAAACVARPSAVQRLESLDAPAPISALCVSRCGSFGAFGAVDGTVCFWRIGGGGGGGPAALHHSACFHDGSHAAPVTALALLAAEACGAQTSLCASAAADQSVVLVDMLSRTRLAALLSPAAAPVCALSLSLVPPHAPAAPPEAPRGAEMERGAEREREGERGGDVGEIGLDGPRLAEMGRDWPRLAEIGRDWSR